MFVYLSLALIDAMRGPFGLPLKSLLWWLTFFIFFR